jgi:hypothetical protein
MSCGPNDAIGIFCIDELAQNKLEGQIRDEPLDFISNKYINLLYG